jgi:hypothetical protein
MPMDYVESTNVNVIVVPGKNMIPKCIIDMGIAVASINDVLHCFSSRQVVQ